VSRREADLTLAGGKIRTPAHPSGFVSALAVRDGIIQAVGSDDEIRELTGRRTRVIDLRGRLALPAFGDAHVHPVGGGWRACAATWSGCGPGRSAWRSWPNTAPRCLRAPG
jgi:Predicted metal-dependent hydrolase with the TIM-barrel fold